MYAGCTEGMDAVFAGGVSPRADTLAMHAGTSAKFDAYLSLTLSLPRKGGQSSFGVQFGACSLVGQLFPFSVNGATFRQVPSAIRY